MTTYALDFNSAAWRVRRFEMRVLPNLRTFAGPYTPTTQVLDLLGERWAVRFDIVPTEDAGVAAEREAFFDRLKGQAHTFSLWHAQHQAPRGTLRDGAAINVVNGTPAAVSVVNGSSAPVTVVGGTPVLATATAQLSNTSYIRTFAGRTVLAGDMISIAGQLVRVMTAATADGTGLLTVEHQPRARSAWPIGSAVVWDRPTANFMLRTPEGVGTVFSPGYVEGASVEAVEVF